MDDLAAAQTDIAYLNELFILLVSAILVVATLHRLRASPVLGYLAAGIVVGPHGFALISDSENLAALSELGVVFLLFTVGLDLSLDRLRTMRRLLFGLGGSQVILTALAIGFIAYMWGNDGNSSLVLGGCLALSSTALVIQLLIDRKEMTSRVGRVSFSVLLFQDLAVAPLLVLVSLLATPEGSMLEALGFATLKALLAIAVILLVGRYLLRWPFRWVAATRRPELFMALALLTVLGTGWLTHMAGLSMALGAFLAGLILSGTEYRHQVEADFKPFRGLLLGLFFMSVGMSLDLGLIADKALEVLAGAAGLIVLKATIAGVLCLAFGLPRSVSLRAGLLLGPGGEFAFVIIAAALAAGVVAPDLAQYFLAVTGLTMLATPGLAWLGSRWAGWLERERQTRALAGIPDAPETLQDHVIIAGLGRVGHTVARMLAAQNVPFVAIDMDPDRVRAGRQDGYRAHYGDASKQDVLSQLGADHALALLITVGDPEAARRTLAMVRRFWPGLRAFARAHGAEDAEEMLRLGAAAAIPETIESSKALARHALDALGAPTEALQKLEH
jgi:CPA2 family monovalent cation:H+ antiporter-2